MTCLFIKCTSHYISLVLRFESMDSDNICVAGGRNKKYSVQQQLDRFLTEQSCHDCTAADDIQRADASKSQGQIYRHKYGNMFECELDEQNQKKQYS